MRIRLLPLFLLAFAPSILAGDVADETGLDKVLAEIGRVRAVLGEQEKTLALLRETIAAQEAAIRRLQGDRGPAAAPPVPVVAAAPSAPLRKWYEKYSFRGYTQFRHNRLLETNSQLVCEACDRSLGNNNAFSIRRARFVLSGDINDRLFFYFQPEFAAASGSLNFGQVRDLYVDVALDKRKEFRVRLGQSKIAFSFENLQSSQNRLALDRADATNSAASNERDIGAFLYYAPKHIRRRFSDLVADGLKGSGDYGVVAFGAYNGQGLNRPEANNNLHYVARVSYPFQLPGSRRIVEPGIAAYTGAYAVTADQRSEGVRGLENHADRRILGSLMIYPQPLGFQAEYNIGKGPRYNPATNSIETRGLQGGYAQAMYMKKLGARVLTPFVKYQYYSGGKKNELDARAYLVRDLDFGLEWQWNSFFEIVTQYTRSDRTFEDARKPNNRQRGSLLRLQVQVSY